MTYGRTPLPADEADGEADQRQPRPISGPEHRLVVGAEVAGDDVNEDRAGRLLELAEPDAPHEPWLAACTESRRQLVGERPCPRDEHGERFLHVCPELAHHPRQHGGRPADAGAEAAHRCPPGGREHGWPAAIRPSRAMVIIELPPKLMKGSVMPVIGAMPIVIPTFRNTWKTSTETIAPATAAEKRLFAIGDRP